MSYQRSRILASACAWVLGMAANGAFAQGAPAAGTTAGAVTEIEEVVVTGSFIKGTPEDSAMPVEVVTYEELQDLGRPSNLDLVKNMSETGGVAGEANRVNFFPIGAATINLRSLGPRFTQVIFNGRRFPEQFSVNTGRFNNISWIPNAAIGSVETLKAGAGAIYGADSVAGVVNYITRKNVDGLELNADYRYIKDSSGDYNADALWGKKYAGGNFLLSVAYQHRSVLKEADRPFGQRAYLENPASYTTISQPGDYVFTLPAGVGGTTAGAILPTFGTGLRNFAGTTIGNVQMGSTGLLRDPNCGALGGFVGWSATPTPVCYINTADAEDLVVESDSFQLYFEHNHTFDNGVKFHTELLGHKFAPKTTISSTFTNNPASWPLLGAPNTPNRSIQVVPGTTGSQAYLVPGSNPAVLNLLNSYKNQDGTPAFTTAQVNAITAGGFVGLQNLVWRPFGLGGNPYADGDLQRNDTRLFRISEAISGNLPEFAGTKLEWEVGLTYAYVFDIRRANDILVDRFQAALNGLGGPNCSGNVAGLNGCQYFNPFSSAYAANIYNGRANPGFVGTGTFNGYTPGQGLQNDPNLVRWLYVPTYFERDYNHYVFDPLIRGDTGIHLPGGNMQIAVGAQFRMQTEEVKVDDYSNRDINPCPTLGVTDCATTAQIGPLMLGRPANVFGAAATNFRPDFRRYPVAAVFTELQLPILDNLELTLAGREEKFYSDVTNRDNKVFVPQGGIKWQALDWLGFRGSWGKTFTQVNPPRATSPIFAAGALNQTYGGLGGAGLAYNTFNYPNLDVQPEKGQYFDVGFLIKAGNFQSNVDYYHIKIEDYTRQMTVAQLVAALAVPGETGAAHINCSSSLLTQPVASLGGKTFIELNGGNAGCVQGVNTIVPAVVGGSNVGTLAGGNVNYFAAVGQTNSGTLETSGIDFNASYRFDNVFGGSLTTALDASYILKWKLGDFVIAGVKVADGYDGVGFLNSRTGKLGIPVEKYRGTFTVTYRWDIHTFNLVTTYLPSLINDSDTDFAVNGSRNVNVGNATGATTTGGNATTAAACTVTPASPYVTDLGSIPAGAGTGLYGGPGVNSGALGYCAAQNATVNSGTELARYYNIDFIYRVQLPAELGLTLTVNNVTNSVPPFFRGIVSYNSAYGSPLLRTYKLGISKKF